MNLVIDARLTPVPSLGDDDALLTAWAHHGDRVALYRGSFATDFLSTRLMDDPSPLARSYAAALMGSSAKDADALIAALEQEPHSRVRETIARVLAQNTFVTGQRVTLAQAAARRHLESETDPAAKTVLEALRDGRDPGPIQVGEHDDSSSTGLQMSYGTLGATGTSWRSGQRILFPPRPVGDDEDPGLPFGDG
jgi:hypothetical protein